MEIDTPRDVALLSKSQSMGSRFGFYSEYDIKSTITGEYPPLRTYWDKVYSYAKTNIRRPRREDILPWFNHYLPCTVWIPQYYRNWNKGWLKKDFFAGLSVCFVEIPQGLSYAQLAGFPAINGLYASSWPLIVFTAFSSCKVLAAGPVAADSVLMGSVISTITKAKHGSDEWVEVGSAVTFTVGLTLLLAGILKLGFLAQLISRPVMQGFIFTAACIVISSQMPTMFGVNTPHEDIPYKNVKWVINYIHRTNRPTFVISIIACLLMDIPRRIKKFPKWIPVPIIIMIISTALSYSYKWDDIWGVKLVGKIPQGIPPLTWPKSSRFFTYFPKAIIIALISYLDGISMGYSVDRQIAEKYKKEKEGYLKSQENGANDAQNILNPAAPALVEPVNVSIDGSQELIAWGLADLMSSFMKSQVISASFSRSGLLLTMEAHTLIPNIMDAIACLIVIAAASSYLYWLPKCILSSIVFVAAFRLFEDSTKEFFFLYKVSRIELWEYLVTAILPIFITLEVGIVLGIATSLGVRLWKSYDAPIIELGQIQGGNIESPQIYYANLKHWKEAKLIPGIKIIELRSELWYSNYRRLVDYIENIVYNDSSVKFIIICLVHSQVTDSTSIREIISIFDDFKDVTICLTHLRKPVRSLLVRFRETVLAEKKEQENPDRSLLTRVRDVVAETKHQFQPTKSIEQGGDDSKFEELLGTNVKTFISTHDAVLYCQKQLAKSGNAQSTPQTELAKSTSERENSAEIKYVGKVSTIEIITEVDKQNDIRTTDSKIQNDEKPSQTGAKGNDTAGFGSSNNETFSD